MDDGSGRPQTAVRDFFPVAFPAYCRIFNPARAGGTARTWAEVAGTATEITGRTQWRDIADQPGAPFLPRLNPAVGAFDAAAAAALAGILAGYTDAPESVSFLAWEGYADLTTPYRASATHPGPFGRMMHVLHAPLRTVGPPVAARGPGMPLCWIPADHSWAVGNDIYARSVYVGGTAACIEAILGEPRLESVPVAAADVVLPEDR